MQPTGRRFNGSGRRMQSGNSWLVVALALGCSLLLAGCLQLITFSETNTSTTTSANPVPIIAIPTTTTTNSSPAANSSAPPANSTAPQANLSTTTSTSVPVAVASADLVSSLQAALPSPSTWAVGAAAGPASHCFQLRKRGLKRFLRAHLRAVLRFPVCHPAVSHRLAIPGGKHERVLVFHLQLPRQLHVLQRVFLRWPGEPDCGGKFFSPLSGWIALGRPRARRIWLLLPATLQFPP